jgi:hypothetical protein
MMLTREQNHVVKSLLKHRDRDQIQTLGGLAGTGKSTVVGVLSAALPHFAVCAFTGKAASVLQARGTRAATIHSLIYTPVPTQTGVEFRLKSRFEIGCQGFLVDEASMISRGLYNDLVSFQLPIFFVGDHGQLPPVGDDVHLMAEPTYRLERIHRNAGEIAHFAEHLRAGKPPRSFEGNDRVKVLRARLAGLLGVKWPKQLTLVWLQRLDKRLGRRGPVRQRFLALGWRDRFLLPLRLGEMIESLTISQGVKS